MKAKSLLIASLALPIVALIANALWHEWARHQGQEVTIPITGFDPRDLLSGHFLTYQLQYGADNSDCRPEGTPAIMCLQPSPQLHVNTAEKPADCDLYIRGQCGGLGRFSANIERFYIPEAYATVLDQKVRNNQGALVLGVDNKGNASIRDLLIEGKPWKAAVAE